VTGERPDPDAASGEPDEQEEAEPDEAYSEDEEAAVAARLEDLGYI
jgi:hypothetical protein